MNIIRLFELLRRGRSFTSLCGVIVLIATDIPWRPSSKRPATTLRCGNIKATIWQNLSEKGPFFATAFFRPFKDQSGQWRNGTSCGLNDLEALMNVAFEAEKWIATHALKP